MKKNSTAKPFTAQFFPEGGNLVYGLKSKVAFQVLNANGKGISCSGLILNQRGDTVATVKPVKFGIGNFMLTPLTGDSYRAQVIDSLGRMQTLNLPKPLDHGYILEVRDSTADLIKVNISSALTNSSGVQVIYLFIHARQMISLAGTYFLNAGKASVLVYKKELGEGISHITLFDSQLVPQCERLYFKPSEKRLSITVKANQQEFGVRRKVTLDIAALNQHEKASLSLAVVKTDSLQQSQSGNIFHYLWLSSDLVGTIESPEYYATTNNNEVAIATDNLMLTHGWRRFTWSDILKKESTNPVFIPEYRGHLVRGVVFDENGAKAGGVETNLSTPGKNIELYIARSNANGEVQYEMRDFWGAKKIIVQTNLTQDSTSQIKILSPFADSTGEYRLPPFALHPSMQRHLLSRSVGMQVQDIFYGDNGRFHLRRIDSLSFYGKADEIYFLDDYTRFTVMEEVMREYVPGVLVRKRKGNFHFMVTDHVGKGIFQEDPLILLDGMPVFDTDKIMAFDPLKVKKLEVITRKYCLGSSVFPGIVSYSTYSGDLGGFQLHPKSVVLDYEGLQLQREFYSPQYDNAKQRESRMPDRRNLLFWAPQLSLNGNEKKTT